MKIINNYCFVSTIMHTSINNYTYMYQQLYILSDCLCKETNKNIKNYICYSILYNVCMYIFPLSISYQLFSQLKDCTLLLYVDDIKNFSLDMKDQAYSKATFVLIQVLTCNLKDWMLILFLTCVGSWLYCWAALHLKLFLDISNLGIPSGCTRSLSACLVLYW